MIHQQNTVSTEDNADPMKDSETEMDVHSSSQARQGSQTFAPQHGPTMRCMQLLSRDEAWSWARQVPSDQAN